MQQSPIAPGAHIELRDAIWRVERVDQSSIGTLAWQCVGVSEIVRVNRRLTVFEWRRIRTRLSSVAR